MAKRIFVVKFNWLIIPFVSLALLVIPFAPNLGFVQARSLEKTLSQRAESAELPGLSAMSEVNQSSRKRRRRAPQRSVPLGTWGGEHIRIIVNADGASVEYDCAHGTLVGTLILNAENKFTITGSHMREGPGPIRIGITRKSRPARYEGKVTGDDMTLTVTLTDTDDEVGTFTLRRGSEGRLRKCR